MTQPLHIINSKRDAGHGWKRFNSYEFAARDNVAPLLVAELLSALPFYPLAFARRGGAEGYTLVALLGLHSQDNLYVSREGRWQVGYVPSIYRAYPFVLQQVAADNEQIRAVLAFNRDSGLYRENPGLGPDEERFFDEQGELQPLVKRLVNFLQESSANRLLTDSAVNALEAAKLLEPWPLTLANPAPERPLVQGLYRINQITLKTLDGETLKTLNQNGALTIAYAQLFSMSRLALLPLLHKQKQAAMPPPQIDLDKLFGNNDDILKFNF